MNIPLLCLAAFLAAFVEVVLVILVVNFFLDRNQHKDVSRTTVDITTVDGQNIKFQNASVKPPEMHFIDAQCPICLSVESDGQWQPSDIPLRLVPEEMCPQCQQVCKKIISVKASGAESEGEA